MPYEKKFQKNYKLLLQFKRKFGTTNIPPRPGKKWFVNLNPKQTQDLKILGRFVETLRRQYRKGELLQYKIDMLNHIGFQWATQTKNVQDKKWLNKLNRLEAFKSKHGHCNVPQHWDVDKELSAFVATCRQCYKRGKISTYKIKILEKIGFEWHPDFSNRKRGSDGRYTNEL